MWIKEPIIPLGQSSDAVLNFLYKSDNIYIMDNHLAAAWSWLDTINVEESYNFIHIDMHYDLLDNPLIIQHRIINQRVKLHTLTLEEYIDLEQNLANDDVCPMFRWDNYILNLNILYPNIFNEKYFCTHKKGNSNNDFITEEFEIHNLIHLLESVFEDEKLSKDWIVNIDLDYFFVTGQGNSKFVMFSESYILELFNLINENKEKIAVLTFCLSPECCGGWKNSLKIVQYINQVFDTGFPINELS